MSAMNGSSTIATDADADADEMVVPLVSMYPVARVDLMPPEIAAQRRFRRAKRVMAVVVLACVAVGGAAYLVSWRSAQAASDALLVEQARTTMLTAQASTYREVPQVLGAIDRSRTALSSSMQREIPWYPYLYQLSLSAPQSLWFETITFTALASDAPATDPLAPSGAVATVTTTGRALSYDDVVTWVDDMDTVTSWEHALLSDAADDPTSTVVSFTSTARLSVEAFSNRYAPGTTLPPVTTPGDPTTETSE